MRAKIIRRTGWVNGCSNKARPEFCRAGGIVAFPLAPRRSLLQSIASARYGNRSDGSARIIGTATLRRVVLQNEDHAVAAAVCCNFG